MSFDFPSRRSPVMATHGMVAASQPLAAQAGLDILKAGGNAADAAVAVAAMLNVVEPMSTGIGGDAFALIYEGRTGRVYALNASGRSPYAATLDGLRSRGHRRMPQQGILSVTVPGAAAGWEDLVRRFGTMSLAQVLAPAISYAEEGFPVSPLIAAGWERTAAKLRADRAAAATYLLQGRAPRPGEIHRQPDLARTLRLVAEGGAEVFYRGEIARAIVEHSRRSGGLLEMADFADHMSSWPEPISITYHGVQIYECPPNGHGLVALLALNMLQDDDLGSRYEFGSPAYVHMLVEALKLAFADGYRYVADPDLSPAPLAELLSADYARQQRARINPQQAADGPVYPYGSDTVYFTTADRFGNAVSFINSLYSGFGSGVVVPGTGICLQNRGALFSFIPGHANVLAPHKRPYHTIIPALATKGGKLLMSFGVMGGFMQPQGHLQVAVNVLDFGMDPQTALDAARVRFDEGRRIAVEPGIARSVRAALRAMGHEVTVERSGGAFGGGQIIMVDAQSGALVAGSDPRKDGCAVGY